MSSFPANWASTKLGKVAKEMFGGGTPSTKNPGFWQGNIPWLTSKSLGDPIYLTAGEKTISEEAVRKSATHIVPAGNLIFATRVGVGKVVVTKIDVAISQDSTGIVVDPTGVDPTFLAYQLRTDSVQRFVEQNKRGATIQGITRTSLQQVDIVIPPLPEQRRIAHVLVTVQTAIEQQARLVALTRELKSALMRKLFTEGLRGDKKTSQVLKTCEVCGERHRADLKHTEIGLVPEGWEVVELGSLARIGNGSTPKRDNKGYWDGGSIPWLTSGKIHERFIEQADEFVTEKAVKECHLPCVRANSLLIAITGQGKTLGNSALIKLETCVSQHLAYVQFHTEKVVPEFMLWYLQTRYQHLRSVSQAGGSTKGALTCGYIKTYPVPLPPIDEQMQIAEICATLDKKERNHERRRLVLEELFRTLLHQLMTGQTRVNDIDLTGL